MSVFNLLLNAHICVLSGFKPPQVCLYLGGVKGPRKPLKTLRNFLCVFLIFYGLSEVCLAYRKLRVIWVNYKICRRVRVGPKTDFYKAFFDIHLGGSKTLSYAGSGALDKELFWGLFDAFLATF